MGGYRKPRLSAEETATFLKLKADGLSAAAIAKSIPRLTARDISHLVAAIDAVDRAALVGERMIWTEQKVEQLRSLKASGLDNLAIARRMKTTWRAIETAAARFCPLPTEELRRCLGGCNQMFRSAGRGHRICNRCRKSDNFRCAA